MHELFHHPIEFSEEDISMRRNKRIKGEGTLDPPCAEPLIAAEQTLRAANDNGCGRRVVILKNFDNLPILIDEIAVIDRLMQDLPVVANDNRAV